MLCDLSANAVVGGGHTNSYWSRDAALSFYNAIGKCGNDTYIVAYIYIFMINCHTQQEELRNDKQKHNSVTFTFILLGRRELALFFRLNIYSKAHVT